MITDFLSVYNYIRERLLEYNIEEVGYCNLNEVDTSVPSRKLALLPKSGSVICILAPFYIGKKEERNIAYYAMSNDYHVLMGNILDTITSELRGKYPQNIFYGFVDTSPINEVRLAASCGLGVIGKNTQLLTKKYGSYCFICEIVTDIECKSLDIEPQPCIGCNRCILACPTGAINENGLNAELCRSELTQKKKELSLWEREQIKDGGYVWGCDICTEVCPYNTKPLETKLDMFKHNINPIVTRENCDDLIAVKSYGWRGKKVILRNLGILEENKN